MGRNQIRVGSKTERDELVARLVEQRYQVVLETERETHLVLPRIMFRDYPVVLMLSLCGIVPGLVYVCMLQFGPRRQMIVTIAP